MAKVYLTLGQVQKKYNKTYTEVRYATLQGRLKGIKAGWQWLYPQDDLPDSWPETQRKMRKLGGESGDG